MDSVYPLSLARSGEEVVVVEVVGGHGIQRRLLELGIRRGAKLRVVRGIHAGPVIVEVEDAPSLVHLNNRIVLGRGIAMKILVRRV